MGKSRKRININIKMGKSRKGIMNENKEEKEK